MSASAGRGPGMPQSAGGSRRARSAGCGEDGSGGGGTPTPDRGSAAGGTPRVSGLIVDPVLIHHLSLGSHYYITVNCGCCLIDEDDEYYYHRREMI